MLGYVLTVALLLGLAIVGYLTWLAGSERLEPTSARRAWGGYLLALLLCVLVLPIGKRDAPATKEVAHAPATERAAGDTAERAPNLVGLTAQEAAERLPATSDGLSVHFAQQPTAGYAEKCRIVEQEPAPGAPIEGELEARCTVTIPRRLRNLSVQQAKQELASRGLGARVANLPASGISKGCRVRTWSPSRTAEPRDMVALTLRCAKPKPKPRPTPSEPEQPRTLAGTPQPDPEPSPTPDYAGMTCPEIGHSFTVPPGSDPEHDADNDGIACESQ